MDSMITLTKRARPLSEVEAAGETERLFHEIRQTLRVTGVPLPLRRLAADERFFPALWAAMRPNAETRAFEEAADRLREEAVHAAAGMDRLSVLGRAQLGESQAFQAENALMLFHYLDVKLLLFASSAAAALEDAPPAPLPGRGRGSADLIERGAPARMPPLELVDEPAEDESVRRAFRDIKRTLGLSEVHEDYRALALWPRYLAAGWLRLKPVVKTAGYRATCERLLALSRELSRTLPHAVPLSRETLARDGQDGSSVLAEVQRLEQELPGLVMNLALLALDWRAPELARRSPFPASPRSPEEAL
jgi:hypothetical protein